MKTYILKTQDIETMLKEQYGEKIEPVDQSKLLQLKRKQQLLKQAGRIFKQPK